MISQFLFNFCIRQKTEALIISGIWNFLKLNLKLLLLWISISQKTCRTFNKKIWIWIASTAFFSATNCLSIHKKEGAVENETSKLKAFIIFDETKSFYWVFLLVASKKTMIIQRANMHIHIKHLPTMTHFKNLD
jgi:hypothetical protein